MTNKFVKLVYLVGFIIKKFVTMHGHTNVNNFYVVLKMNCLYSRYDIHKILRFRRSLKICFINWFTFLKGRLFLVVQ